MVSTVICLALLIGAEPTPPPNALWLWTIAAQEQQQHPACVGGACWAWVMAQQKVCECGSGCPCCDNGPCQCDSGQCKKQSQREIYNALRERAVKEQKPLLVSVGCEPKKIDGVLTCRWDKFPAVTSGVVVGLPKGNELIQGPVLPCNSSVATIQAATKPTVKAPLN